jgi:toxin ParE1/3/4
MSLYIISDEAIRDLDDISNYFLGTNLEAGEQFLKAFDTKCKQLASFPNMGRSYAQIRPDLRGLALRQHIIVYRVSTAQDVVKIEILRVVSGRRDLKSLFLPN